MSARLNYEEDFMKEFENLRRLNHPNIVQLLGYCYETKRIGVEHEGKYVLADESYRALCFDYMHNGSLQRYLDGEMMVVVYICIIYYWPCFFARPF
jgi:interleukin-1 receptor-associated kinase 1/coatomer subunit beta'